MLCHMAQLLMPVLLLLLLLLLLALHCIAIPGGGSDPAGTVWRLQMAGNVCTTCSGFTCQG